MKVKIFVAVKVKVERKKMFGSLVTFSWALCCEALLKKKLKFYVTGEKNDLRKKMSGLWVTPLVGRHVVNDSEIA